MKIKDLENRIASLELALKATVHEPTIKEARELLSYYRLFYKVKTRKNYYGKNIR